MKELSSMSDWDRVEKDANRKIARVADKTGNESLEDLAETVDPKKAHEKRVNCRVARQILDQCLEKYQNGEYTWKVAVEDTCEAFEALL